MRQHPDLRPEEVYAALANFYDHFEELVAAMQESVARAAAARTPSPFSREELLKRREGRGARP